MLKLMFELIRAVLEFIRQLFGIPTTETFDSVSYEQRTNIINIQYKDISQIKKIFDESEYQKVKTHFERLKLETVYIDSKNNKRALSAFYMSILHKIPSAYWLEFYQGNNTGHLFESIGKHAYQVCKNNSTNMGNHIDSNILSKDMRYYL